MNAVTAEILNALETLGYKNKNPVIKDLGLNRYEVWVDGELISRIGIYDVDRHTFVD